MHSYFDWHSSCRKASVFIFFSFFLFCFPKNCKKRICFLNIFDVFHYSQLIPGSTPLPDSSAGYHFYYSLFGNNVTNESFSNLIRPEFAPERASVKIRSSLQVLSVFLSKQPGIQVGPALFVVEFFV